MKESIIIRPVANGYVVTECTKLGVGKDDHAFETFDALVAHLRRELPATPNAETPRFVNDKGDVFEGTPGKIAPAGYRPGAIYMPTPAPVTASGGILRNLGVGARHDENYCEACQTEKCSFPVNKDGSLKKPLW